MSNILPTGERLKQERERLGYSQTEFASMAGKTRKTLFGYETGARSPDAEALAVWAASGLDILYVVTGQRSVPVQPEQTRISRRENAMLDNYRACDEEDRKAIERIALSASSPKEELKKSG